MLVDCSEQILGDIIPAIRINLNNINILDCRTKCTDSYDIANFIKIPRNVVDELRKTGIPLGWYNLGELQDAILACSYDGTLIDDPEGISFRDQLELTFEEKLEREKSRQRLPLNSFDDDRFSP